MRVNEWAVLRRCIDEGITSGLRKMEKRGYDLGAESGLEAAADEMWNYIGAEISEYFDMEED